MRTFVFLQSVAEAVQLGEFYLEADVSLGQAHIATGDASPDTHDPLTTHPVLLPPHPHPPTLFLSPAHPPPLPNPTVSCSQS